MTAFVNANDLGFDRLGITISRKVARRAVDRNRIKRLLRETFRLSANARSDLKLHYDWVFNGRFHLSEVGLTKSSADFKSIIERVQQDEFA